MDGNAAGCAAAHNDASRKRKVLHDAEPMQVTTACRSATQAQLAAGAGPSDSLQPQKQLVVFNLFSLEGYSIAEAAGCRCVAVSPCLMPTAPPRGLSRRFCAALPHLHARLENAGPGEPPCFKLVRRSLRVSRRPVVAALGLAEGLPWRRPCQRCHFKLFCLTCRRIHASGSFSSSAVRLIPTHRRLRLLQGRLPGRTWSTGCGRCLARSGRTGGRRRSACRRCRWLPPLALVPCRRRRRCCTHCPVASFPGPAIGRPP